MTLTTSPSRIALKLVKKLTGGVMMVGEVQFNNGGAKAAYIKGPGCELILFKVRRGILWYPITHILLEDVSEKTIKICMEKIKMAKFTKSEMTKLVHEESVIKFFENNDVSQDDVENVVEEVFRKGNTAPFSVLLKVCKEGFEEMDDDFAREMFNTCTVAPVGDDDEDEEPEAKPALKKSKKKVVEEEDDDEDEEPEAKPAPKKSKKKVVEEDDDEDDDEVKAPPPKTKKPKAKGDGASSWGPGYSRPEKEDAKVGKFNIHNATGKVLQAIGKKGATLEQIAEKSGLEVDKVKFQLRTAARSCGLGFSIDSKGILTIQGKYELSTEEVDMSDRMEKLRAGREAAAAHRKAEGDVGTKKTKKAPPVEIDDDDDEDDEPEAKPAQKKKNKK